MNFKGGGTATASEDWRSWMQSEEAKIQAEVVQYLQSQKIFCHSVPNEAAGTQMIRQMQLIAMGLRKGVADLVVWWPDGRIGYLEMKDRKGRQSDVQKVFEKRCNDYGVRYDLARSVEDVKKLVGKYSWAKEK